MEFESRLVLKFLSFSLWHILEFVFEGFIQVLRFPSLLHRLTFSIKKEFFKKKAISALSQAQADLSLRST